MSDLMKFLKVFRLTGEKVWVGLLHENESMEKNPLPKMIHIEMDLKDFNKKSISSITGTYKFENPKTKQMQEVPIYLLTQNKQGRGIFLVINPGGTSSNEITDIRAYFIDADFGKVSATRATKEEAEQLQTYLVDTGEYSKVTVEENKEGTFIIKGLRTQKEIQKRKDEFLDTYKEELKTCLITETYSGFHSYWPLEVPDAETNDFKAVQKALAKRFGTDISISNLPRIMRMPEFNHVKYDDPFAVRVIQWNTKRWTKQELIDTYGLQLVEEQTAGVRREEKVEQDFFGNVSFYTKKKVLAKPNIKFKKPSIPFAEHTPISFNLFVDEVRKRPFTDFIESPAMEMGTLCCPFHNDTNPSASVFITEEGTYGFKCFSCEADFKDIIGIYQQTYDSTHVDSVRALASIAGYEIVTTPFEEQQYRKYRINRRFLIKENIEMYYPNLWFWINPDGRYKNLMNILDFMNSYAETSFQKDEYQYNGEQTFFIAYHEVKRRVGNTLKTVFRAIKFFNILGLVDNIEHSVIHAELKKKSEEERLKGMWKEKQLREQQGKPFDESKYREINYYSVPVWQDRMDEIEKMARKLRDCGFSFGKDISKKDIALILGDDIANKVYPDERVKPKAYSRLFN
ncbi:hypothetical protein J2W44_006100, partial [Priestia aryabhattai]|uniref:CHC2 zinc finger domain-containing protein n=1 Tax=Priestia aryabhattai TaxID=412384 RepID=UPI0027E45380